MYVILSGKLLIYKLKKNIDTAGPGEYLGEMSLIDSQSRSASVRGIGSVTLLEIDEEDFKKFILPEPQALFSMMKTLTQRTRNHLNTITSEHQKLHCLVHDIRNFLAPLGISEVRLEQVLKTLGGTDESQHKRNGWKEQEIGLNKMRMVKSNLIALIDQTLIFGTKTRSEYVKTSSSMKELVQETVEEIALHQYLSTKNIKTTFSGDILNSNFNHIDVKRVLQNLIVNAGHASKKNETIEILIQDQGDSIQVSVIDQGTGIPDNIKPIILKEKYTTKSDGNGLGLLSCRDIIENYHQGEIWFESRDGEGTKFHFKIPY
jgi:signal transduction histidine kinase